MVKINKTWKVKFQNALKVGKFLNTHWRYFSL